MTRNRFLIQSDPKSCPNQNKKNTQILQLYYPKFYRSFFLQLFDYIYVCLYIWKQSTRQAFLLKRKIYFPFKTNGREFDFECPIHGIINSGKIEGAYFGRVRSIFWPKKLHNDFFLKVSFSNFERWIITCLIVALFRLFTVLSFLKNRYHSGWSVRTLDQDTFVVNF